jgi:hypothetical protein
VQHDEVADALVLEARLAVVFAALDLVEAAVREEVDQALDRRLDQMDAGRLDRLEEAAGQADGDHVAVPGLLAHPGLELDQARLGQRLAVEIGQQGRCASSSLMKRLQ